MSQGTNLIFSIVKSGDKNQLNKVRDDYLISKSLDGASEVDILNVVRNHVFKYRVLPTPDILKGQGIDYDDTNQPVDYYVNELKKRMVYNAYKEFRRTFDPNVSGTMDMDQCVEAVTNFSGLVTRISASDQYRSLKHLGRDIEIQLESRKNGVPEVFIPFGWPTLDSLTGGASGGDLSYFVARPGTGKSQLICHMAHHAWTQGFSPLVLTMEMTDMQIARRIYGITGQFNHDVLRRGEVSSTIDTKLRDAIAAINEGPEFNIICGQVRQTVESITSLVDELQPDVLYIDAAYLINMRNSNAKSWEKIAMISEKLKELAISRNIPIILTVQFNREAKNKSKFSLENIAGSDAIGQLGSLVVSVTEGEEGYEETRRVLEMLKNREGGLAKFNIEFTFDPPTFNEILRPFIDTTDLVQYSEDM